jgi:flagellar assembly protein FliH
MPIERHQASGLFPPLTLPSFDEVAQQPPGEPAQATSDEAELPTASELEAVWEAARHDGYAAGYAAGKEEGFAAGHAEGYAQGFAEGKAAGETAGYAEGFDRGQEEGRAEGAAAAKSEWEPRLREQLAAASELVTALKEQFQALPQRLAEPVATLAIEIARAVLENELATHPKTVVAVAEAALRTALEQPATLRAHPDDAAFLTEALSGNAGITIVADPQLCRGSVVIEGENFLVDATLPSRWRRVVGRIAPQAANWSLPDDAPPAAH